MCEKDERKMKTKISSSGSRRDSSSSKSDKQHENTRLELANLGKKKTSASVQLSLFSSLITLTLATKNNKGSQPSVLTV